MAKGGCTFRARYAQEYSKTSIEYPRMEIRTISNKTEVVEVGDYVYGLSGSRQNWGGKVTGIRDGGYCWNLLVSARYKNSVAVNPALVFSIPKNSNWSETIQIIKTANTVEDSPFNGIFSDGDGIEDT